MVLVPESDCSSRSCKITLLCVCISELIPINSGTTFIRKPENPLLIYYCHSHKELLNKWKSHPENQSSLLVLSWKASILWVFERTGITGGFIYSDLLTKIKYVLQHWQILHKESVEYQSGIHMYIICGKVTSTTVLILLGKIISY